ncbi:type II secretion system F family protein [Escherichia coli]|nr:type II secretion system F family protein [Escherichia coli]
MNFTFNGNILLRMSFTTKDRMSFYRKLERYISNGVSMVKAIESIYALEIESGKRNAASTAVLKNILTSLRNGKTFSDSLLGYAPIDEISIISAGEVSGNISSALDNIMYISSSKKKIKRAIAGITYPITLIFSTIFFMYIFGTQVVPAFEQVLPVEKWTGPGKTMYLLSVFVKDYLFLFVMSLVSLCVVIMVTLPYWTSKIRLYFDRFPPWSVYKSVLGCGFLLSLSSLLQAGIPAPEAIKILTKNASPWYKEKLLAIRYALFNGAANIGDALHITGFDFPNKQMVLDIRTYAGLNGFEMMLNKLSKEWQEDMVSFIEAQMSLLRNLAIVIMGGVFMWIISGMFSLQQQISDAAQF